MSPVLLEPGFSIMAEGLEVLFRIKAKNEAANEMKSLERQIASLKERIKEVKAESAGEIGFKKERITALQGSLASLITRHKELKTTTNETAKAHTEFSNALTVLSPRIGGLVSSVTETSGAFATLFTKMGPIGIAAAGIAVEVAAVAIGFGVLVKIGQTVIETFFGLAKSAAGFRGELFDLSQQTGVNVETLNALDIAASKTGGNIQSISQSLVIFQGHLDDAQNDVSDMGQKFKELGISTDDTETSLREAIRVLADMEEGFEQTNLAAELFGRRGGKQFLAIIKESGGDIDSVVRKLGQLAEITEEEARAADQFNDSLRELNILLRNAIGKEAIPAATKALQELQRFLVENQGAVHALGVAVRIAGLAFEGWVRGITAGLEIINGLTQAVARSIPGLERLAQLYEQIAKAAGLIQPLSGVTGGVGGVSALRGLTGGVSAPERAKRSGGGADPAADARRLAEIELQIVLDNLNAEEAAINRSLDRREIDFGEYALAIRAKENERHQAVIDGLNEEGAAVERLRNGRKRQIAEAEIQRKLQQEELTHKKNLQAVDDAFADRVQIITDFIKEQNKAIAESQVATSKWMGAVDDLIESLKNEGIVLAPAIEWMLRFKAAAAGAAESSRQLLEVTEAIGPAAASLLSGTPLTDDQLAAAAGAAANAATSDLVAGADAAAAANERHLATVNTLRGAYEGFAASIASGVGQLIQNFLLMEKQGPKAFQKVTAAALASVSARAAADAIYEFAIGIAALTPWGAAVYGPAPFHFKSAALLAGIAAIAGAGAKGIAGGAFSSAPGAGGADRTDTSGSRGALDTIIQNRNQRGGQVVRHEHVLRIVTNDSHIVETIGKNWRDGGGLRELVLNDGN